MVVGSEFVIYYISYTGILMSCYYSSFHIIRQINVLFCALPLNAFIKIPR